MLNKRVAISINWEMTVPPLYPTRSFDWPNFDWDLCQSELEARLNWPACTIEILKRAFSYRLSRDTKWNIDPDSALQLAFKKAASVFKRGVSCSVGGDCSPKKLNGFYDICFYEKFNEISENTFFQVIDAKFYRLWEHKFEKPHLLILATEQEKSLETVAAILEAWQKNGQLPHWQIIGGGLIADIAAFAASLVGCSFELIPTTLLAMVDACVGGKTGVNFQPYGKNQIGHFAFPTKVSITKEWLTTLSTQDIKAGGFECLKHTFLQSDRKICDVTANALANKNIGDLWEILPDLVQVKADIVRKDPSEIGIRATLNLGHTLAHALEAECLEVKPSSDFLHGEAVGFGLVYAVCLSEEARCLDRRKALELLQIIFKSKCLPDRAYLNNALKAELSDPSLWSRLFYHMGFDKKNIDSNPRWILLKDFGEIVTSKNGSFQIPIEKEVCDKAWKKFLAILPTN